MTEKEILLNYHYTVEQAIRKLRINPDNVKDHEDVGLWTLARGSAHVYIKLFYEMAREIPYMSVVCPVMEVPNENRKAFMEELLILNEKMFATGFSIDGSTVYLRTIRPVWGMDENEAFNLINRVGYYADLYDDQLINVYGGDIQFNLDKSQIRFY